MAIRLQKGEKINLSKDYRGLSHVIIGLGWDERPKKRPHPPKGFCNCIARIFAGNNIDCDAFALALPDGAITGNKDIIYFGHLAHPTLPIRHLGDNLTGAGYGDNEQITIDLSKVPSNYQIIIAVNIYMADVRGQHFGMINNAFIRLVDANDDTEVCRYNLSENYDDMVTVLFGELYNKNGDWRFRAAGEGYKDKSIDEFVKRYKK